MRKYYYFSFIFIIIVAVAAVIYKYRYQIPSPQSIIETVAPIPTIVDIKTGLPDRHQIKTAFVPQAPEKNWDQPWQDSCEEAAILTVHYYYQEKNPELSTMLNDYQELFNFETSQNWTHDVNLNQMATISAKLWDYKSKIIDNPTLEDIKRSISENIPVIVPANGKSLFKENTHFKNGGPWYHNLVILGYDDVKKLFTVHDVGTQFGAYFHYSYPTLMASIHDFPDTLKKEDIDLGVPRVLLLLK